MTPQQQAILLFNLESHLCSCVSWRNTAWDGTHGEYCQYAELLRLIEVKVAEEREACARVADAIAARHRAEYEETFDALDEEFASIAELIAVQIRLRRKN